MGGLDFWLFRYGGNFCALREWVVWRWKRSKKCLLKESINEAYPWGENDYLKAKDALNKYLGRKQMFRTKGFVFAKWVVWQTRLWNSSWRDWGRKLKSVNLEMPLVWMRKFATRWSESFCHTTFAASLRNGQLWHFRNWGNLEYSEKQACKIRGVANEVNSNEKGNSRVPGKNV